MFKAMSDAELDKIEEKGKFSGWDRNECSALVKKLLTEIRSLKKMVYALHSKAFLDVLDKSIDDHEMVVIEIEELKRALPEGKTMELEAFVTDVKTRAKWEAIINPKNATVIFYKKRSEMGVESKDGDQMREMLVNRGDSSS